MQVRLFPDTARQFIILSVLLAEPHELHLSIYDALGNCCRQSTVPRAAIHKVRISVADLPRGAYYVQIKADNQCVVKTISLIS